MDYNTDDISAVVPIAPRNLNAYIHRSHITPEHGRNGRGKALRLTRSDALQVAVVQELNGAGVPLKRAPLFWALIEAQSDLSRLVLYVGERPDGSDTDFKLAYGPARPADVPATAARIDVGALRASLWRKLDNLDAERITADPVAFPHRFPFVASHNPGAPWSVFLAREPGEPDAETIARLCEAVEAKSHILIAGATRDAMLSLVAVTDRMLRGVPAFA